MADDMATGWGVRTLSATARRYNPMSYHNGSVWPHDTAIAAMGMLRYGFTDSFLTLATGLFQASSSAADGRRGRISRVGRATPRR